MSEVLQEYPENTEIQAEFNELLGIREPAKIQMAEGSEGPKGPTSPGAEILRTSSSAAQRRHWAVSDCAARTSRDWPQIAALYGELVRLTGSAVVELNRAIAIAETDGAEAGLAVVDRLDLDGYPGPRSREYRPQQNIRFRDWAERWLASLERKETTKDSYRSTVAWATELFGEKVVRRLRPEDIGRFNAHLREHGISASTRAKHLRVLGACLNAAVAHGYAARNPVRDLPKAERPRPQRKEAAYFEDEELIRLFAEVPNGLFRVLFEVALKTGMRQGELLALTWGDVDLGEAVIRVRRSVTDGHVSLPKNHERRDVDLTADVVELLGAWWGKCGRPVDDVLVFPADSGGYLTPSTILRGSCTRR